MNKHNIMKYKQTIIYQVKPQLKAIYFNNYI